MKSIENPELIVRGAFSLFKKIDNTEATQTVYI